MKQFALLLVTFGIVLSPTHSQGQFTGIDLQHECQSAVEAMKTKQVTFQAAHCIGFVTGVAYTMSMWEQTNKDTHQSLQSVPACIPEAASPEEYVKVVLHYMDEHPNQLHNSEGLLVFFALHDAYPCKAK